VNLIGNLYVSNGMSAGNTPMEARTQALSEIFERHTKYRIIEEGLCLPDVPEDVINRYPRIAASIRALRCAGFGILVKDASLGGRYPVMNVTLLHPKDQGCFASFGAHPRLEVALERALTELLQGRALDSLAGFPAPGFDQTEISDPQNLEIHFVDSSGVISWQFLRDSPDFEFVDWNFGTTTEEDYAWSVDALHGDGHEIYIADFEHLGVYACRILVPGVSEIYPFEELEFENNSVGNLIRPALARLPELSDDECDELLDLITELELADDRLVPVLIGLAPDADSPWTDLRIGELKLLLALALGDDEAILEGCTWIAQYGQRSEARLKVYRCIADLAQLDAPTYFEPALALLYGRETLEQVLLHLVQNAIDASPEGMAVFLQCNVDGINGCIEVIDTGTGMSAEFMRNRLFKPFVSTKPGGFGIGAFEAREMVRTMRGKLDVESREGLGSRFAVRLPLAAAQPLMDSIQGEPKPAGSTQGKKVA
ncbi:MAG: hypothetical protein B7Y31_07615, partial [Novosphingobium sp. 16-62-11]